MNQEEKATALFADVLERHVPVGGRCQCGDPDAWAQHVATILVEEAKRQRVVVGRRRLI